MGGPPLSIQIPNRLKTSAHCIVQVEFGRVREPDSAEAASMLRIGNRCLFDNNGTVIFNTAQFIRRSFEVYGASQISAVIKLPKTLRFSESRATAVVWTHFHRPYTIADRY